MFKKALAQESKLFLKAKSIQARRPSEYWLEFLKKNILAKEKKNRSWIMWLFLIPVFLFIFLIIIASSDSSNYSYEGWFIALVILFIILVIVAIASSTFFNRSFVDPNSFDHLAKFIVKVKGDTAKNLIGINLNATNIQESANVMDLKLLGLKETGQTKYAAYQIERYVASFRFKDDSFCSISLYQVTVKTTTTKRRSSGKMKTKSKFKHKFYFILSLKLSAEAYDVSTNPTLLALKDSYEISVRTENGFHIIKIKHKKKHQNIYSEMTAIQKKRPSIFTTMLQHLFEQKIIRSTSNQLPTS